MIFPEASNNILASIQKLPFTIQPNQVPSYIWSFGLASGETATLQQCRFDLNDALNVSPHADNDYETVAYDSANYILTDTTTRILIPGPGRYQLLTTTTAGAVTLGIATS